MITDDWNMADKDTGLIGVWNAANKIGGHAVLLCWYDDKTVGWQNSWGTEWGCGGFGRMSWDQFEEQFLYAVVLE